MSERIDYVKVCFRGNVEDAVAWIDRQRNIVLDWTEPRKVEPSKFCNTDRFFDFTNKAWVNVFETWGEAADFYFENMPFTDRANVLRVDYRMDVDNPGVRISTIEHVTRVNAGRTRRTVTRIDSPPRAKKGDRDAGGQFLAVGAKGTEKRVTFYKRASEPWALEVQFGKGVPFLMHQEAARKSLEPDSTGYYNEYMKICYERFRGAIADYLHFSVEAIQGEEKVPHNQQALNFQETLLENFDTFWSQMDEQARAVVREVVTTDPEKYATMEVELEEPDHLWSDQWPDNP